MSVTSRRRFLAGAGAAGVAAALPTARAEAAQPLVRCEKALEAGALKGTAVFEPTPKGVGDVSISKTFKLGKSFLNEGEAITASRWGIFYAQVKGGRVCGYRPFEYDYDPSVNLPGYLNLPYNNARIRYPYVRKGFLENGPASRDQRGRDEYVRVDWDTALNLAAKHIDRIYDDYGPSAVWGTSYGWQSSGKVNGGMYMVNRLLSARGGYVAGENNYSYAAVGRMLPYVIGSGDPRSTCWDVVIEKSQRVIFWGCDPLITNDIDWYTTIHKSSGYFKALKAKGTKTIAINPLYPDTAEYLGSDWIKVRPGTDTALMLGVISEMLASKKADMKFLQTYTAGWREFLDYVEGKTDGVKKSVSWAADKTGVPAKVIKKLAHEIADNRTMVMMGWGPQRAQYGEQFHWMGYAMMSVAGQIGLPGGGVGTNYQYSGGGSPTGMGPFLGAVSGSVKPAKSFNENWKGAKSIPVARFPDCFLNPGKVIDFDGQKITYPEIRLVMWAGGNPFGHQPQSFQVEEAWRKPEVTICTDINWTATARHADIVFPACTTFEHNDISNIGTYANEGMVAMKKVIEPQFESRSDYWIHAEIAKRMGIGEAFTEGRTEDEWIEKLYNDAAAMGKMLGQKMPSFEEFWEKGYIMYDIDPKSLEYVQLGDFRADPKTHALGTESGKIQLFSPKVAGYGYADCLGHPAYFEPNESLNTATKQAPLGAVVGKSRYRLHSQLDSTTSHSYYDIDGREPCLINPKDAKDRGIKNGDLLLVSNKRGKCMSVAYVSEQVMPGVICIKEGAWFAPAETQHGLVDVHGSSNSLTQDIPTSSLAQGNVSNTILCQVEKWTGDIPEMYVWDQPKVSNR